MKSVGLWGLWDWCFLPIAPMLVHNTKFVEMLDKKDSIVWQEKYPVQAGIADGHIYIDKELNPEDYRIHAYTRFSFLDDTIRPFYPKKIRIVKTIANKGYDSSVPRGYASC